MVNNSTEILREIEAAIASLKERLQALEAQVEDYRKAAAGEAEVDFDMEIGVAELPEVPAPAVEGIPEAVPEDLPVEEPVEMVMEDLPEPVAAEAAERK